MGNCNSIRRVDLYKYVGNKHILCIEIDENQHRGYSKIDEENRYHELYKDGYISIFIRYNPDKYRDINGKTKHPQFKTRMKFLLETIDKTVDEINNGDYNDELLYIKKLYYNEEKK